jgi:Icc-related predicted phosphoesterase
MKLLLFSDLHASETAAVNVARLARNVDVLVGAGDFGNARRDIDRCLKILKMVDKPAVLVAGNNESTEELRAASADWPSAVVLHGDAVDIGGVTFFGLGGGVPVTPFGSWSYDFTEDQARALLASCPPEAVLVSHSPPKGILDQSSSGASLGSVAVREAIDRTRPRLVVCGHIHASGGKQESIGGTVVVNAGPAGMIFEFTLRSIGA